MPGAAPAGGGAPIICGPAVNINCGSAAKKDRRNLIKRTKSFLFVPLFSDPVDTVHVMLGLISNFPVPGHDQTTKQLTSTNRCVYVVT